MEVWITGTEGRWAESWKKWEDDRVVHSIAGIVEEQNIQMQVTEQNKLQCKIVME